MPIKSRLACRTLIESGCAGSRQTGRGRQRPRETETEGEGAGERETETAVGFACFWDRIRATLSLCATSHLHVARSRNGQPAAGYVCGNVDVDDVDGTVCVCVDVVIMRPPTAWML